MSWVNGWLGGGVEVSGVDEVVLPSPVESPLSTSDPEYVDLVARAINRLPEYAKRKGPG